MSKYSMTIPESNLEPQFGDNLSQRELREAVEEYANWYVEKHEALSEVDLSDVVFSISTQMKRAAGKAGRKHGEEILRMAWNAYKDWGWDEHWKGTIQHELIHIWQVQIHNDVNHGRTFKRKAREIDAPMECKQFVNYKYKFFCTECGKQNGGRFKRSKMVKEIDKYRSKCCSASIEVRT